MRYYTNVQMIGNEFLVRGYEDGKSFKTREQYRPTLFVPSKKRTKYKTLDGKYVQSIQPGFVRDCREFYKRHDAIEGFEIYGNNRYIYQYISDKYPEQEIKFDINKIKLVTIDIEVKSEKGFPTVENCDEEMLCITLQDYATKRILTFGIGPYHHNDKMVKYVQCNDEYDLLQHFINFWSHDPPEVVTGWNCQLYDIPYLAKRITRVLGDKACKKLSPWGLVTNEEIYMQGRGHLVYDIGGVTVLDYLDLYKKFTYKAQESYKLDYIGEVELGQRKVSNPFDTFKEFYAKDWNKFVDYNIQDVRLVDSLEEKMKLIELAVTMAFDAKVNFTDVFYQVRMWDMIIYNELKKKNIVIPPKTQANKDEKYAGAYVKEPIPGKYDWVVSFDLNSLYPHLIMQYNISPETLLDERYPNVSVDRLLNEEVDLSHLDEVTVCPNGAMFTTKTRGFLPKLMDKIYGERVVFKKKMIQAKKKYEKTPTKALEKEIARCNNIQMAKKIQLNSAYGAIGNNYFRYYKLANAEAITLGGQFSIRWIENRMNQYMNRVLKTQGEDYVIASDTDSIYLNMGPLVETVYKGREVSNEDIVSFLDKVCDLELEKYISSAYEALAEYVNAYEQKMFMKRETIAERGIWTAKKRYMLNAWDIEGVRFAEPKLKMMGIEAVKSSTPAPCRKMIKEAIGIIMSKTEEDVIDYIDQKRNEFKKMDPADIAFPRSCNNVDKYHSNLSIYSKGTPIHVRGALLFNHYIKKHKVDSKYTAINNGDKIKFCYLAKPNPIQENVISFSGDFPRELGLNQYVDYTLMFEKSFLEPLKAILDSIGWHVEKVATLESFFT